MLLVLSPNWFPIFICFVKLAREHRFCLSFSQTGAHKHTHTGFFFSLRIYGHLQSGCGFCKHNLLWLPPSVSSMHQQPCLSEQHKHTRTHTHVRSHSWEWTECRTDSRGGGERHYTSCLFLVRYLPGPRSCYWNSRRHRDLEVLCVRLPQSRSIVRLCLSSCHLTQQLTIPFKLTV